MLNGCLRGLAALLRDVFGFVVAQALRAGIVWDATAKTVTAQ